MNGLHPVEQAILTNHIHDALASLVFGRDLSLRTAHEFAENLLPAFVTRAITTVLDSFATSERLNYFSDEHGRIVIEDVCYQATVASHHTEPSVLVATVITSPPALPHMNKRPISAKVSRLGRYTEIQLYTSKLLARSREHVLSAAAFAVDTTYNELLQQTIRRLNTINNETGALLYAELRRALPAALVDKIWLYAFSEGKGFYIPDESARDIAIKNLEKRSLPTTRSPMMLITDFTTQITPFETTFTRIAVQNRQPIVGVFKNAPYRKKGLDLSERGVYDASGLVTHPIAQSGSTIITAGYPVEIAAELKGKLKQISPSLKRVIDSQQKLVQKQLKDLCALRGTTAQAEVDWIDALILKPSVSGIGIDINKILSNRRGKKG